MATPYDKVKVMVKPEVDEVDGTPVEGSGGFKEVTAEELEDLNKQNRLKSDFYQTAKKELRIQKKAHEKGNYPPPPGEALNSSGDIVPYNSPQATIKSEVSASAVNKADRIPDAPPPNDRTTMFGKASEQPTVGGMGSNQKFKLISKNPDLITADSILAPLLKTGNGVVFPYTPTINWNYQTNYGTYDITHSIYQQNYYINTPNPTASITATFAPQTIDDMAYAVAALQFLKSCTKSDFGAYTMEGKINEQAGLPPPVLLMSGYGDINAKNVPVVIRSVNYTFPDDVDYVTIAFEGGHWKEVKETEFEKQAAEEGFKNGMEKTKDYRRLGNGVMSLPSQFLLSIEVAVQQPPAKVRNRFDIRGYRSGTLLGEGFM